MTRTIRSASSEPRQVRSARSDSSQAQRSPRRAASSNTAREEAAQSSARSQSAAQASNAAVAAERGTASSSVRAHQPGERRARMRAAAHQMALHFHPATWYTLGIGFLVAVILFSLWMNTQTIQMSFKITHVQASVSNLTQDVQARQTKLDALQGNLPNEAQKLGMTTPSTNATIDLSQPVSPEQITGKPSAGSANKPANSAIKSANSANASTGATTPNSTSTSTASTNATGSKQ